MKKLFTLLALVICLTNLKAQYVTITDTNFVAYLHTNMPTAMNGNQMDTTSLAVITWTNINVENSGIRDLTGVQYFDSLKTLDCSNGYYSLRPNTILSLPSLPSTLDSLICGRDSLLSLPTLPITLKYLACYSNLLTSLPVLPNGLITLNCSSNNLTSLPLLPGTLVTLNCSSNPLNTITSLPNSIAYLNCSSNQLTNLPALPDSIIELACYNNQLTTISSLPNTLVSLTCSSNLLGSLPTLPTTLSSLFCSGNLLTSLPTLPNSLGFLECAGNQIISLPLLPTSLYYLNCINNQLTSLPVLPTTLSTLYCSNNNISCFNPFNFISNISISNNPFTCLPNYIPTMDAPTLHYPLCIAGNANGCADAYGIVGFTYKDKNTNCHKDSGDLGMKNIPIKIYSNSNNVIGNTYTAINGVYQFLQTANTYSVVIDTAGLPFESTCLYPGLDSSVTVATLDTNINFALACKPGFDVGIQSINVNGIVFPGQPHGLNVNAGDITHWFNSNCASGLSGSLSFSVNGPVTYVGPAAGSLTPSIVGNVYTYNIVDFDSINNLSDFNLRFITDTTAIAGDVICVNATVTPTSGDNNQTNNTYTTCYNVVNSHDPNVKEVYPVEVEPNFHDWLTYTIHFQNTGSAPAFNISLTDTLDNMLDLSTFQVINYSHQNNIDLSNNVLHVRFPNILLPDSTSDSAGSIGFIQYRAKPKTTWAAPYQIKNTAYIYFDYNAPIITNTTRNSILKTTGFKKLTETVMALYPNPSNGTFTIELNTKEKQLLEVFDMTGNVTLSQSFENGKATIEANHLAAGIYNISIKGNNSVVNKKLVIVK